MRYSSDPVQRGYARRSSLNLSTSRRQHGGVSVGAIVVTILVVAALVATPVISHSTAREETITVESAERVCDTTTEGSKCRFLVFAVEGTYENTDAFWFGKFNSSDVHRMLVSGGRFRVQVTGWRLPFFSTYPNIIKVVEKLPT